jgi:hypothetical protein
MYTYIHAHKQTGEKLDIIIPGFYSDAGRDVTFAFDVVTTKIDPGFPDSLPERNPQYRPLGCFKDVLTDRAVGGGKW